MGETEIFDLPRRVVSHMTSKSWRDIPHVSYLYEPDVTEFYREYRLLAGEWAGGGKKLSFNTVMLRAILEGLKSAPKLNALVSYSHKKSEGSLKTCSDINISVPWMLPDGRMITPVLLHTESKSLEELAGSIEEMTARIKKTNVDELLYRAARADTVGELKKLHLGIFRRILASQIGFHRIRGLSGKEKSKYYRIPEEKRLTDGNLISGTVVVSNIGSLYPGQKGCFGLLEIIPPQVFAVGLGALQEKPGVYATQAGEKAIGIRNFLPMCLAFDHRAVDFSVLVPFLKTLDRIFAEPGVIRTW
jgi:pyruvate/2-oxoglutarate dehydrogenase complex dihydrolipoamide acyltransferase (E2) component